MASVQERLAESLRVLKVYQDNNRSMIIKGQQVLGVTHTKRLLDNGYLQTIIKGWYMPSFPGSEGDTTVWYASYWDFIVAYANDRFGQEWCLTPEESLSYYAGETVVPAQLIIRAKRASNNIIQMKFADSLLDISSDIPEDIYVEPRYGLRLYPLAEALVFCTPQYYKSDALNARTCLSSVKDASEIIRIVADDGLTTRASRIIGALQNIGREEMADEIMRFMQRLGYTIRPEDPFTVKAGPVELDRSPYVVRLKLMWEDMRGQILALDMPEPSPELNIDRILANMEANYVKDSYHSLSIEGYRVTEGLIERVRSGSWNPDKAEDSERKNALIARGYFQAFQAVKESVKKIVAGANAGDIFKSDHNDWHFELFQPCVTAGIIKAGDLAGYRTQQVYIRGSKHTPLNPDAVRDAMPTLCELLKKEDNVLVRAVLGHFFFVYIHPYMDGNGRTGRFLLNTMLLSGGYNWTVIPVEKRESYMAALEKASIEGDIRQFAQFIFDTMTSTDK